MHEDVVVSTSLLSTVSNSDPSIFITADHDYVPSFELCTLIESLKFDYNFLSGRKAQLFGNLPYAYGKVKHFPTKFDANPYIFEMYKYVTTRFPSFELNSCLINYYPSGSTKIPDHSDDEQYIDSNSLILTLSLGAEREMEFKRKSNDQLLARVKLGNRTLLIFTKNSQFMFTHGIPPQYFLDDYIPRVSATFRKIVHQ